MSSTITNPANNNKPINILINNEPNPINQIGASSGKLCQDRLAASGILFAQGAEIVASAALELTAIYATMNVCKFAWSPLMTSLVWSRPESKTFLDVVGFLGSTALATTGIGLWTLVGGLPTFAVSNMTANAIKAKIKAGRLKIEKMARPEARQIANNAIDELPPSVKAIARSTFTRCWFFANIVGLAAITDLVFKTNMTKGAVIIAGISSCVLIGGVLAMKYSPEYRYHVYQTEQALKGNYKNKSTVSEELTENTRSTLPKPDINSISENANSKELKNQYNTHEKNSVDDVVETTTKDVPLTVESSNQQLAEKIIAAKKWDENVKDICSGDFLVDPIAHLLRKMIERGVGMLRMDDGARAFIISQIPGFIEKVSSPEYLRSFAEHYFQNKSNKAEIMQTFEKSLSSEEFQQDLKLAVQQFKSLQEDSLDYAERFLRTSLTIYHQSAQLEEYSHPAFANME